MSAKNFKKGDTIQFKKDLVIGNYYGRYPFSTEMPKLLDHQFLIIYVGFDHYQLNGLAVGYFVTDEMIEPAKSISRPESTLRKFGEI